MWNSPTITAFSVLAINNGVLVGTSDKGRIYSITDDGRDTLLLQSTEGQISALVARGTDTYAASSNQGRLYHFGESVVNEGGYESPVRDAFARRSNPWGPMTWRFA